MALIKKTVVLSLKGVQGYLTVIRVGSETGIKVVGENFTADMKAGVRMGEETVFFPLQGSRTELVVSSALSEGDGIGCLVTTDHTVVARGGAAPSMEAVENYFATSRPPQAETAAAPAEKPNADRSLEEPDKEILDRLSRERKDYYLSVKEKMDELFVVNPTEETLGALIPDSEWVKVRYDGDDYYVVGRLYDRGKVSFLGYGVPGVESVKPPKVADGIATFLPIKNSPDKGYWLFFQNAGSGKIE